MACAIDWKSDPRGWQYDKDKAKRVKLLSAAANGVLTKLDTRARCQEVAGDTRSSHAKLFEDLMPPWCGHLAGRYRGTDCCPVVRDYAVFFGSAYVGNSAGFTADVVCREMESVVARVRESMADLDPRWERGDHKKKDGEFLNRLIHFAALHFYEILRIHPYADGNGHAARVFLWAFMSRYGFKPHRLTVEPRPLDFDNVPMPSVHEIPALRARSDGLLPYTFSLRLYALEPLFLHRLIMLSLQPIKSGS